MKYYFAPEIDDERCYTLECIKDLMLFHEIEETEIIQAERMTGEGFYWCKYFGEVGESGDGCGKQCKEYSPRNGKNGRCRHSGYCYEPTGEKRTIKIKL